MRVVHVTAFRQFSAGAITFGGLERFLGALIAAQRRSGLDVGVLDVDAGLLTSAAGAIGRLDWDGVAELGRDAIVAADADVFHCHDWYGGVAFEALYRTGHRGLVMTSHLPLRRGFTYRDVGLGWEHKYLLEDRCLRAAGLVTVPSAYAGRFVAAEYGVPPARLRVVPHGVDAASFRAPDRPAAGADASRLLAVGRLTEQKGFELLVRAMPVLLRTEPAATLTIIGDGGRRDSLCRLVDQLGLGASVCVLPAQNEVQLGRSFAAASLLVMPSQFEPFGLVGLEAMACGCPVLASAPSGAAEYLGSDELTTAYSPARLGAAIVRRLAELRGAGVGSAALRARAGAFSWDRAAAAYRALYEECAR